MDWENLIKNPSNFSMLILNNEQVGRGKTKGGVVGVDGICRLKKSKGSVLAKTDGV